jgi:MSHA biogenesis protein MshE
MMDALRREDHEAFARAVRENDDYESLSKMAYNFAVKGITSIEEVMKVAEIIK